MYVSFFIIPSHEATLSINQLSDPIMIVKEASTAQERISSDAANRKREKELWAVTVTGISWAGARGKGLQFLRKCHT